MAITIEEEVDDFLEHFGVRGMHWGSRGAAKPMSRGENRARNKASRNADRANFESTVDAARIRRKSGDIKKDWKASKEQFRKDKVDLGSREARKIMNEKKIKLNQEHMTSKQAKTGKEAVKVLLIGVGALVVAKGLGNFVANKVLAQQ